MHSHRSDLSLLAIAVLFVLQATVATYGVRLVREAAAHTHDSLMAVARPATR
jgi:hypothetical protein